MGLIKLIIKLLVLPLIVAVTLIQWVGIFFTQFSTVIFNLLAGLMFLITIAGWMFGISAGAETLQLLAVAFVVFIIPHIAEWLIIRIAVINYGLRDLSSPDPTILYRQQSDRYFLVKSLPLLFYQIKGEQNYDNEPEESTVRLWQP